MFRTLLFVAPLLLLPGCGGQQTLAQQQMATLNALSGTLTTADTLALGCVADGVALCVNNKAAIKAASQKIDSDIKAGEAIVAAGGDATTPMQTITQELAAFALLYTQQALKT